MNHSLAVAPFPGAATKAVTAQAPFVGVATVPAANWPPLQPVPKPSVQKTCANEVPDKKRETNKKQE
jgi:hypothetical protein